MKSLINEDSGQVGAIFALVMGLFVVGFMFVAFGSMMNGIQDVNNDILAAGDLPFSQAHWNAADLIFKYWYYLGIFVIILYVIYGIKNGLSKDDTEVY